MQTYADKEVIAASILRVRPARLRSGFGAFVAVKERGLDAKSRGWREFIATRFFVL
jgi:hypothetical protein